MAEVERYKYPPQQLFELHKRLGDLWLQHNRATSEEEKCRIYAEYCSICQTAHELEHKMQQTKPTMRNNQFAMGVYYACIVIIVMGLLFGIMIMM